jgi:hypothetical protein
MSESEDYPERIEDSEDYSKQRRLKSVFDIRKEIHETRRDIKFQTHKLSQRHQAITAYRSLVESYLLEIEPLLRRYGDGEYYLTEYDFGRLTLAPETRSSDEITLHQVELYFPNRDNQYERNSDGWENVKEEYVPDPVAYDFTGLQSLFEAPDTLILHDEVKEDDSLKAETYTYINKSQIPMSMLDEMVRVMNEFISDIGFELEPEKEDDPANLSL